MTDKNIVDSFYRLKIDLSGDDSNLTKIPLLQECAPPTTEKIKDNITPTDAQEEVFAVVDFKKNSDIDFEIVLDPTDPTHQKLDEMWESNEEVMFEYEFVKLKRKKSFKAQLVKWEESTDKEKKLRMKGTLTLSQVNTTTTPTGP